MSNSKASRAAPAFRSGIAALPAAAVNHSNIAAICGVGLSAAVREVTRESGEPADAESMPPRAPMPAEYCNSPGRSWPDRISP